MTGTFILVRFQNHFFCFPEQDIENVCKEINRQGVTIPAFQKIGGLLAGDDLNVNESVLHAAIVQINQALDKKVFVG